MEYLLFSVTLKSVYILSLIDFPVDIQEEGEDFSDGCHL